MPSEYSNKRREFVKSAGLGIAMIPLMPSVLANTVQDKSRPNILLLFSDQHNADFLGCANHPFVKTPNLDQLAATGVRFTRAYCQDGICVPSRTSVFTGLYPRTTGCLDNPNKPIKPEQYPMLQHLMRDQGYATGCFGKRHLPNTGEMALGWGHSATVISPKQDPSDENYWDWIKERGQWDAFQRDWVGSHDENLGSHVSDLKPEERDAAYTADKTLTFLKQCKEKTSPFFCWTTFHGPHQPYTPPKKWADLYPPEKMPLPPNVAEPVENLTPAMRSWRQNTKTPWNLGKAATDDAIYRRYISCYAAQVSEVDHYIGQVLSGLEKMGLRENTIVIYVSDHGDFVARHGMVEKCAVGQNVYEDTLRVPLIISWSGKYRQGDTRNDLVELIDLFPTILEAASLKRSSIAPPLAGRSLLPTLQKGKPVGRKVAFSENWSQVTIISERYKLAVWIQTGENPRYRDLRDKCHEFLFDREKDPHETHNLIGSADHAKVESELRDELANWIERTPSQGKEAIIQTWKKGAPPRKPKQK